MRWVLTRAGCLLVSVLVTKPMGAHAQEPSGGYTVFGVGNDSCTVAEQSNADVAKSWVLGYFSALNVVNRQNHNVGAGADANGIMEGVKLVCDTNPYEPFFNAASAVYLKLQQEGH
jgi:hypothetical protein